MRATQSKNVSALSTSPIRLIASAMNEPSRSHENAYGGNVGEATYPPAGDWPARMTSTLRRWRSFKVVEAPMDEALGPTVELVVVELGNGVVVRHDSVAGTGRVARGIRPRAGDAVLAE